MAEFINLRESNAPDVTPELQADIDGLVLRHVTPDELEPGESVYALSTSELRTLIGEVCADAAKWQALTGVISTEVLPADVPEPALRSTINRNNPSIEWIKWRRAITGDCATIVREEGRQLIRERYGKE